MQADTFFEQNVTWTYETSLEYHCPKAKAFEDSLGARHDSQVKKNLTAAEFEHFLCHLECGASNANSWETTH